jgi:Flp pilus assembly protein TadG
MEYPDAQRCAFVQCDQSLKHHGNATGPQSIRRSFFLPFRVCYRECEGTQLVEFALVAPILFALILGMVLVGLAINNYAILTDAVSQGSRAFALARNENDITGGDPCAYAVQVANADAATLNTANIKYTITYTPVGSATSTSYTNTCTALGGDAMNSQDTVVMQGTYPVVFPSMGSSGIFVWTKAATLNLVAHTAQLVQ